MVTGNGMIAKRFESYREQDRFLIFASGVSNSKTEDKNAYAREMTLLQESIRLHPQKTFIYFSTCSLYDPAEKESKYVQHKKKIEEYIHKNLSAYHIFRVSNLVGKSGNHNTILNYFVQHISNGINFDLWENTTRNLVDIDDMFLLVDHILRHNLFPNQAINIANPVSYPTRKIVKAIEDFYDVKASYIPIAKGKSFEINVSSILPLTRELGIRFGKDYLVRLLQKYYNRE